MGEIYSFVNIFNKYLLGMYYPPGPGLHAGDTKTAADTCPQGQSSERRQVDLGARNHRCVWSVTEERSLGF